MHYSFTVQATGSSTVIEFSYRDDPGYLSLDDVSVTGSISAQSVPEPSSAVLACLSTLMIVAMPLRSRRLRNAR